MLKAPLVGNVYLAPGPGKPPFVAPGTAVKKGQTLCIIEAMKVMNEFPAPRDGVVAVVHVKNEQLVEYGQPLFT
ncbi:acetyl-CoA carboxylase, biotin carboxyl carrier protein, partial [Ruminococcaceae bacterium OttesenSCG-928-D13]|nr:acetyl-CoA carboxylase, biotin carboxyl carrier protein [Ruminococcaceae bacterium OttesenSCG-928-D13]